MPIRNWDLKQSRFNTNSDPPATRSQPLQINRSQFAFLEEIDRPVKSLKLLFEFPGILRNYSIVYFYGLFWGEQQPFVSSGCGGL